ncbi:hypothetical protein LZ31DRAFT_239145 [Colletotrichum somersetense]|nr:hypothetical protein LZ31DRAFT_239145 [Colletotrichum somersetense]
MWPKSLKRRSGPSRVLVSQNQQRQRSGSQPCVCVYVYKLCGLSPMPPVSQRPTWRQVSKFRLKSESDRVCC